MPMLIQDVPSSDIRMYRKFPQTFMDMCGWKYWEKQEEIMQSVRDFELTGVVSCPDSGKTYLAARISAWWLNVYAPSKVIVMAPLHRQIKDLFWSEFRACYKDSGELKLRGVPHIEPYMEVEEEWFIRGIIAREEEKAGSILDKLTGYHSPHLLIILDQSDGLNTDVWRAIWNLRTSPHVRLLALSNPWDCESEFGCIRNPNKNTLFGLKSVTDGKIKPNEKGEGWNIIKIKAVDTPNIKSQADVIPGLFSYKRFLEYQKNWAPTDPMYQMMLEANDVEGTRLAVFPDSLVEKLFRPVDIEIPEPDFDDIKIGIDVADEGLDRTVWTVMAGNRLLCIKSVIGHNTISVTRKSLELLHYIEAMTGRQPDSWIVDKIGIGKSQVDNLDELGFSVTGVNVGESVDDKMEKSRFANKKSEMYWHVRDVAETTNICLIPYLDTDIMELQYLEDEMRKVLYSLRDNGRITIQKKSDLRRSLKRSCDNLDSFVLSLYEYTNAGLIQLVDVTEKFDLAKLLNTRIIEATDPFSLSDAEFGSRYFDDDDYD